MSRLTILELRDTIALDLERIAENEAVVNNNWLPVNEENVQRIMDSNFSEDFPKEQIVAQASLNQLYTNTIKCISELSRQIDFYEPKPTECVDLLLKNIELAIKKDDFYDKSVFFALVRSADYFFDVRISDVEYCKREMEDFVNLSRAKLPDYMRWGLFVDELYKSLEDGSTTFSFKDMVKLAGKITFRKQESGVKPSADIADHTAHLLNRYERAFKENQKDDLKDVREQLIKAITPEQPGYKNRLFSKGLGIKEYVSVAKKVFERKAASKQAQTVAAYSM